jgi:glucokinase
MLVGVDIGGTKTAVIVAEDPSRILYREEFSTLQHLGPEQSIEKIKQHIELALERHGGSSSIQLGVSCGGPLDRVRGIIKSPPNLQSWIDIPIKQTLEDWFNAPCLVENDANACAVAEHRYGAGKGCDNLIFLTLGTGLGAGLILNGELYRGATEMAGEIGHVRLTNEGPVGYGKAGSVEGWASGWGMTQYAQERIAAAFRSGEETQLAPLNAAGRLTAKDIGVAAVNGDTVAQKIVKHTGEKLGHALAILVDILNPERIILGGLALRLGSLLLDPALAVLRREALPQSAEGCIVTPAGLGERIGDISALCVAEGVSRVSELGGLPFRRQRR